MAILSWIADRPSLRIVAADWDREPFDLLMILGTERKCCFLVDVEPRLARYKLLALPWIQALVLSWDTVGLRNVHRHGA